jgi:hypothetical protein
MIAESRGRERRFVDTNLFVYAHDESAGHKRETTRGLIEALRESRELRRPQCRTELRWRAGCEPLRDGTRSLNQTASTANLYGALVGALRAASDHNRSDVVGSSGDPLDGQGVPLEML